MPRFILAEFNTHRVFSRNAGSSRAIPIHKRIEMVEKYGFEPHVWGKNQKGMQAEDIVENSIAFQASQVWSEAMRDAVKAARKLAELGIHKQLANRILEPFVWVDVIVSSTEWDNFFNLRISPLAQPEIREVAIRMKDALDTSNPVPLKWGMWHSPLHDNREVAVGRIARVSYESDPKSEESDILLGDRLRKDGHWSPFEHIAQASNQTGNRNFTRGWCQWRAMLDDG